MLTFIVCWGRFMWRRCLTSIWFFIIKIRRNVYGYPYLERPFYIRTGPCFFHAGHFGRPKTSHDSNLSLDYTGMDNKWVAIRSSQSMLRRATHCFSTMEIGAFYIVLTGKRRMLVVKKIRQTSPTMCLCFDFLYCLESHCIVSKPLSPFISIDLSWLTWWGCRVTQRWLIAKWT